jgi:hypothetical protein
LTRTDSIPAAPAGGAAPSTAWKEVVAPGEERMFRDFLAVIERQQKKFAATPGGAPHRGFHAKPHAGLAAEFRVLDGLPEHARHGVFREPRVFPAVVRFSNGRAGIGSDRKPEPRGIAIKLAGVPGPKLTEGQRDAVTQDFLATSHSVTSTVRNAAQFIAFIRSVQNPLEFPLQLPFSVGLRETVRIVKGLAAIRASKVNSMATEHYSSTAPIQYGPYAVKFTVRPAEGTPPAPAGGQSDDFLRDELADRLRNADLVLDFVVQFFVDETRTPIEDTSVPWSPADAPFLRVAQLRIPRCDLDDAAARAYSAAVDRLSFSPWHAIEEHRPLGSIMRARRLAYPASSAFRHHAPEPSSLPLEIDPPTR